MDTLREKLLLNNLWEKGKAPWKTRNSHLKNVYQFSKKCDENF